MEEEEHHHLDDRIRLQASATTHTAEDTTRDDNGQVGQTRPTIAMASAPALPSALISGAVAGAVAKTFVAPFDRVKLLFQVSSERFSFAAGLHKTQYLLRHEGVLSLWKGNSAVIARVLPATAVNYAAYLEFKKRLNAYYSSSDHHHHQTLQRRAVQSWGINFVSGAGAGMISTLSTHPLDVIRARLAVEPGRRTVGLIGMGMRIYGEHSGFRGLWVGITPAMIGIVPYSGTIWMMNQMFRDALSNVTQREATVGEKLLCGGMAGLVGQWVTYPLDTIRRRMQVSSVIVTQDVPQGSTTHRIPSITATVRHLIRTEGVLALFKGFSINWIKGPVASGIRFTMVEVVDNLLQKSR